MDIIFECEKCGERLQTYIPVYENQDKVHCKCGKIWIVIKPIAGEKEE